MDSRSSVRRAPAISFPELARKEKALAGGQRTLLSPIIGDYLDFALANCELHPYICSVGGASGEINDKILCLRDGDSLIS